MTCSSEQTTTATNRNKKRESPIASLKMPSNPSLEAVSAANATKRKNAPRDDEDSASESGSDVVSPLLALL